MIPEYTSHQKTYANSNLGIFRLRMSLVGMSFAGFRKRAPLIITKTGTDQRTRLPLKAARYQSKEMKAE